jgi:hypothetical protein
MAGFRSRLAGRRIVGRPLPVSKGFAAAKRLQAQEKPFLA